jgi:hypothetical protein
MFGRLIRCWCYGGGLAGALLLALTPLIAAGWSRAMTLTFLTLPIYMLHQLEEHDDDRFRRFFNDTIAHGREGLTPLAVFVVNIFGVWCVIATAIYLAWAVSSGWGLIAVYLVAVNALVHLAHSVMFRRYNPGLATAAVLFVPLSGAALWTIDAAGRYHAMGLVTALVLHAVIIIHVKRRLTAL